MPHDDTIISDTDLHYQYVPIASLIQGSASDYTEVLLEDGETATNSGVVVITNEIKAEFVPNAFGKARHGASVWDIKQWTFDTSREVEMETAQVTNAMEYGVHNSAATRTVRPRAHEVGYLIAHHMFATDFATASGEVGTVTELVKQDPMPIERQPSGNSFNYLATKSRYVLYLDGTGEDVSVVSLSLGIWARRVIVPLTELFFDRETIAGLLDNVILDSIFG